MCETATGVVVALVGSEFVEANSFAYILLNTDAVLIHEAEVVLCARKVLGGSKLVQQHCMRNALGNTQAVAVPGGSVTRRDAWTVGSTYMKARLFCARGRPC